MFFDIFGGSNKINSLGPGSFWKHKVLERGNLSSEQKIWPIFLFVSHMIIVKELFWGVQKIFRHLLWKV